MRTVGPFTIMKALVDEDNQGIQLAALSENLVRATYNQKRGTEVTIGVAGNVVAKLMNNGLRGGLILMDTNAYEKKKKELESTDEIDDPCALAVAVGLLEYFSDAMHRPAGFSDFMDRMKARKLMLTPCQHILRTGVCGTDHEYVDGVAYHRP